MNGEDKEYEYDIANRYLHGEFFNEDSIRQTGDVYTTSIGRKVYGGGGIMPDYFVAEDTTLFTTYYQEVVQKGLVSQFCFEFTDNNRPRYLNCHNGEEVLKQLRKDRVIQQFINYCDAKGVKRRNNMILKSQQLIEKVIHGGILYNLLDMSEYLKFINKDDVTIMKSIQLFNDQLTTPTLPKDEQATDKETAYATPNPTLRGWLSA